MTKEQLTEMKIFTIDDVRSWKPCYDPKRYLSEGWRGTAIDILEHNEIPPRDKPWVVCREAILDAKTLRLFAVWCARQVEHLMTDERSRNALNVAERFAHGEATQEELDEAATAAYAAADAAAYAADAARSAAARSAAYARYAAAYAAAYAADAAAYAADAAAYAADAAAYAADTADTADTADAARFAAAYAADAAAYAADTADTADTAYAARVAAAYAADAAANAADAADTADTAYAAYAARSAQVSKLLEMLKKQEPKDKPIDL